ncbi:MAG TPA: HNH endonuclease signature motif containing protein [Candidatus Saccharimonadales bacterium]
MFQPGRWQDRFLSNVDKPDKIGCWVWKGSLDKSGYGRMKIQNKGYAAHRLSYFLYKGIIPDGLWVLHTCDNRPCVNPEHLYVGDVQQNMRDAVERNRMAKGARNGSVTHAEKRYKNWLIWRKSVPDLVKGEKNGRAKLNTDQVQTIRELYQNGNLNKEELGRQFNVSGVLIGKIIRNELWAHVN